ncbi:MAG: hypothetical protein HC765_05540 [Brachymonas sp.]|nr:hypothetical protein [Brachymonas sp.]
MKKILTLLATLTFCTFTYTQQTDNYKDSDAKSRLEIATNLVNSTASVNGSNSLPFMTNYATEEGLQREIDRAYPKLNELAKLRVVSALTDVVKRHSGMFERFVTLVNRAMAENIALKFSLVELQSIAAQSQGKTLDSLNLLSNKEIEKIAAVQLDLVKPDIERFVNDFLATNQRLVQQGLITK